MRGIRRGTAFLALGLASVLLCASPALAADASPFGTIPSACAKAKGKKKHHKKRHGHKQGHGAKRAAGKKKHKHRKHKQRPYRSCYAGRFVTEVNPFTFSQAPMWSPDGKRVVSYKVIDGTQQVITSKLDGSGQVCVTCGQPGPNQVAQYRPQGDVILFHSWREKNAFKVGSPGFGGVGSEVYVTNADGSGNPVNLTQKTDATSEGDTTGEGEDNYHAYFSPDGRKLSWTHLDCNAVTQNGSCQMEILVADYVAKPTPHLANVKVARPEDGHYYETQLWAPDGSGFLYTESMDNSLNLELFFYRLSDGKTIRLTRNAAWDEQATFTPDMSKIIFMSTRDHPGLFNDYRALADSIGLGADTDFVTVLPVFELGFLQPVAGESTDLYELDPASGQVRRLTNSGDDGWIVPEFSFDPGSRRMLYTEARFPPGTRAQLPVDAARDIQELLTYILTGKANPALTGNANVGLDSVAGLERRTIVAHYAG